jgi:hypothetical protein
VWFTIQKKRSGILVPKIETQPIIQQLKDKNNTTGFLINKIPPEHNGENLALRSSDPNTLRMSVTKRSHIVLG